MFRKISDFFVCFWEKSIDSSRLSFFEKIFFFLLIVLEKIYTFFFFLILKFKEKLLTRARFKFKILSVGNISVGGTGKTVFVKFLIDRLSGFSGAIALRGYKSKIEKKGNSFLIYPKKIKKTEVELVGDEAFMFSRQLNVPIAVGANRVESCRLLEKKIRDLDFVVLDDAYQNYKLFKDLDILLMDAAKPFENGHCLPAGRLREKDYSRADVIVLTHSDFVPKFRLNKVINKLSGKIDREKIFLGKHKIDNIFFKDLYPTDVKEIQNKNILAFAGIGSFSSFKESVKDIFKRQVLFREFPDHHSYTKKDLSDILDYLSLVDIIITTQKDWVKILPLIEHDFNLPVYILRVGFDFLHKEEGDRFFNYLNRKLF